jgi:hypothetical protein
LPPCCPICRTIIPVGEEAIPLRPIPSVPAQAVALSNEEEVLYARLISLYPIYHDKISSSVGIDIPSLSKLLTKQLHNPLVVLFAIEKLLESAPGLVEVLAKQSGILSALIPLLASEQPEQRRLVIKMLSALAKRYQVVYFRRCTARVNAEHQAACSEALFIQLRPCGHVICEQYASRFHTVEDIMCPVCRAIKRKVKIFWSS